MSDKPFEVVVIIKVPKDSVSAFQEAIAGVLVLLPDYDGQVSRRLRTKDGTAEILILKFVSGSDYTRFLDAERTSPAGQRLTVSLRADIEHIVVAEVEDESALAYAADHVT